MKVSRLVSIIILLMDKKRVSAKELAEMFEVSPRTIYRDIEAISIAGIPIHSISGVGGGFEIMEKYKMDKNTFTEADLITILVGISSIPSIMKSNDFVNTQTKIRSLIPSDRIESAHIQAKQMYIDSSQWLGDRNLETYLTIIKRALQTNHLLTFNYINHKGNRTKRQVEPYQMVLKNSQWYFQGYCYERNDFRLFKVARLSNLKMDESSFVPKSPPALPLLTPEILNKLQISIKLRIHASIMERLLDYCDYNQFVKEDATHYIVTFPFIENDYYYGIILSLGDKCECLEPLHVRTELKRKIASLTQLYDK
ncbi:helix-turn-helix transcriptional regulator [Enterococcus gallinarum]|uniref:helix-turn-helix transcriptional regulator n=1 Tax=Enterococcus gallinarum TaxID=1353 RepID=UPI0012E0E197|nr:YafY family protein [Enterococcus gallinarum]MUO31954.1 WYL domain-containing protein [Enterococcus gallinarum]